MSSCLECKHYKRSERIGVKCCEIGIQEGYCEKDKEDFAIEEFKKIKAEIEKEREELADVKDWGRYYGLSIALETIDKHISELKGENNE